MIEKLFRLLYKQSNGIGHIKGKLYYVHCSRSFWFLGVNFRPQVLQCLILRSPIVVVFRTPFAVVLVEPQYGHLKGLPLGIDITSRDIEEA